jgi:hypothetical protein
MRGPIDHPLDPFAGGAGAAEQGHLGQGGQAVHRIGAELAQHLAGRGPEHVASAQHDRQATALGLASLAHGDHPGHHRQFARGRGLPCRR